MTTYGHYLPEIGESLIKEMERVQHLEFKAREARKQLNATISREWTQQERQNAKRAACEAYKTKFGQYPIHAALIRAF